MDLSKVEIGKNYPEDCNVVIEIPAESEGIKYEFDKDLGMVVVDRFVATPMNYPANYGFVPNTLSGDGDPIDVLVVSPYKLQPGILINVRPIGVLLMEDESGEDEKVIAVPTSKLTNLYDDVNTYKDLPEGFIKKIEFFFANYKGLEPNKFVKIIGWEDQNKAKEMMVKASKAVK